ncbi:uncharacterized protein LOC143081020 [Mytilus galloprovincialis]|uniref:uncharacterized protein LOC143081020 n=1 Tax=Mytilus galloprovincialis TaxID=29158 RepID=UPI003F7C7AC6
MEFIAKSDTCLANIERKKRESDEEERQKKENDERKNTEEKERKRGEEKEEKEKRKREKEKATRQKKEEEDRKKMRDWKNWKPFIYYNSKQNHFRQKICCVIYTMPDGTQESDFVCQGSDTVEDLYTCLESNEEQIISSAIEIQSRKGKSIFDKLELPMRVYVPVVSHDESLLPTLKFSNGGKKWRSGKSLPEIHLPKLKGVPFVGVEIPIEQFENLQCVAVARHHRHEIEVDEGGKVFEPEIDRNIKVRFPQKAFAGKTVVATKAVPWTHADIENASKKHKDLHNIKTAGSYIDISCEKTTKEDSDLEMYDFGWVVDKTLHQNQSVNQETLNRCSRWIVNNLNPDENELQLNDVFDSDFLEELKTKETEGDKSRLIIRHLHETNSDSDFDKFLVQLTSSQPNVATRINSVKHQVVLSRSHKDTDSENNFASDFDPDFEKKQGTICVVSRVTGKSWEVVPVEESEAHPNARFLKLPSGSDKYQVFGLVVPDNMSDEDICKAAEILEGLNCVTTVSIICRQKHSNPHEVIIECVKSENVDTTMKHLDSIGYNDGPAESAEFGVVDGEEIEIKFESNLYLQRLKRSPLRMTFYKHLKSERYSEHLVVVNKAEQGEDISYHGYLEYSVSSARLSLKRSGSLAVYVPKPLEELIGNFPYTIDVPVKAMAKFIAWQLTCTNFNSTKWVGLGGYLTDGDSHLYRQICKNVDKQAANAPQRERCEQYILYWANHHAPLESDKVEKIIKSHHNDKMESEAHQFIKPYLPGKGIFSNDSLEKMAFAIAAEWESMATKLGFEKDEINQIKSSQPSTVKQTLRMLDVWRLSDSAIQKGTDLVKSFHETAKSAKCGAKLQTIISKNIN